MILFRAKLKRDGLHGAEIDVLIYAENEYDAARYLKGLPLFWHLKIEPAAFKEVAAPKGPAPSILLYSSSEAAVSAD